MPFLGLIFPDELRRRLTAQQRAADDRVRNLIEAIHDRFPAAGVRAHPNVGAIVKMIEAALLPESIETKVIRLLPKRTRSPRKKKTGEAVIRTMPFQVETRDAPPAA